MFSQIKGGEQMTEAIETIKTQIAVTVDAQKAERLNQCEKRMERSFLDIAGALAEIKKQQLFVEAGFEFFYPYCKSRWKLSKASAKRMINAAPILAAIPSAAPFGATILEGHVRPVYGMSPQRAVQTLQRAYEAAPLDRDGQPRLTQKLVEQTARKSGWKPENEWIEEQRAARSGVPVKLAGQRQLESLFQKIVTQHSPEETVDRYGAARTWNWFPQLSDWMDRARAVKP